MHDALEVFSDGQDLSQIVGSYLSDKSVDLWNGARQTSVMSNTPPLDFGAGEEIKIDIVVCEAFVGATATVLVEVVMADNEALDSNLVSLTQAPGGSITVGIPVATLVQGYKWRVSLPRHGISKRWLGLRYNIFTATTTSGTVNAYLAKDTANPPGVFR